jgi:hypothetical protein
MTSDPTMSILICGKDTGLTSVYPQFLVERWWAGVEPIIMWENLRGNPGSLPETLQGWGAWFWSKGRYKGGDLGEIRTSKASAYIRKVYHSFIHLKDSWNKFEKINFLVIIWDQFCLFTWNQIRIKIKQAPSPAKIDHAMFVFYLHLPQHSHQSNNWCSEDQETGSE